MSKGAILVVPAFERGRGSGHLVRAMALVRGLRALDREAYLFLPAAATQGQALLNRSSFESNWLIDADNAHRREWECIVLDRFQTPPQEYTHWSSIAPLIGIDEGGPCRGNGDFLIDILPGVHRISANIVDPSLLPLPPFSPRPQAPADEETEAAPLKILVSFGQEDTAGLGSAVMQALVAHNTRGAARITTTAAMPIAYLARHLPEYDLIITHYGLTAFEALYSGIPALLVSPGAYHEKLAKKAGFFSAGTGKKRAAKIARLLLRDGNVQRAFMRRLKTQCAALAVKYDLDHAPRQSLAAFINSLAPQVSRHCPFCGAAIHSPVRARYTERSYRQCKRCGIIIMERINAPSITYEREYFFEHYQKQYGKTYIEDFPHLTAMGKRRLAIIKTLLPAAMLTPNNKPSLIDIGCAYGPFLQAAREEGFSPLGIDPAQDAVDYVTHTLHIPALCGFFPLTSLSSPAQPNSRDVITLWYVIEHFRSGAPVLREIRRLLKPGGILAFATPSFTGISGRSSLKRFLEHSPADHWTIWSPAAGRRALKAAGFTVKKIVSCGHHPERFPFVGRYAQTKKSPLYHLLWGISVFLSLGDTFEVYAVKDETLENR